MLSRVADSVFWMARYMERTNGMLRIVRTNFISSQDEVKDFSWQTLLRNYSDAPEHELKEIGNNTPKVLEHLLFDKTNSASVLNNITKARTDRFIQRVVLSVIAGVEGGMLVSFILLKGLF